MKPKSNLLLDPYFCTPAQSFLSLFEVVQDARFNYPRLAQEFQPNTRRR